MHSSSPTPPPTTPTAPLLPPGIRAPQGGAAADEAMRRAKTSFGALGTIATSPMGVMRPANLATKTLLGGA